MRAVNIIGYSDRLRLEVGTIIANQLKKEGYKIAAYPRITHNLEDMQQKGLDYVVTYESHMIYWGSEGIDSYYPEDDDAVNIIIDELNPKEEAENKYVQRVKTEMLEEAFDFNMLEIHDRNNYEAEVKEQLEVIKSWLED